MSARLFHFGEGERRLLGAYHEPEGPARRAVLICPPFGEEGVRAFRILRELADRLRADGVAALRFDYFGTSDSAGEGADISLAGCVADALCADEELRDLSGARRVGWLGLGFGGAVCALAAREAGLRALLLWSPVLNGAHYLQRLRDDEGAFHRETFTLSQREAERRIAAGRPQSLGAPLPDPFVRELEAFALEPASIKAASLAALAPRGDDLFERLPGARALFADDAQSWNSNAALNAFVMPREAIRCAADYFAEAL